MASAMRPKPSFLYRQSAVLPYRRRQGRLEILLVTSSDGRRWTIPKGVVESWLSAAESAEKEAFEEAGIIGRIHPPSIGSYAYRKWGGKCRVEVFLFEVIEVLSVWPEADTRKRQWLNFDQAAECATEPKLQAFIRAAGKFFSNDSQNFLGKEFPSGWMESS